MKERHRIGKIQATLMYAVAIIFDLIGIIPLVASAISILSFALYWAWFGINGASYIKKPIRIVRAALLGLFGFIPIIGSLPLEHIATVFLNLRDVRKEDRLFNENLRKRYASEIEEAKRIERALWLREQRRISREGGIEEEPGYSEAA
jgi:hypothetical protein